MFQFKEIVTSIGILSTRVICRDDKKFYFGRIPFIVNLFLFFRGFCKVGASILHCKPVTFSGFLSEKDFIYPAQSLLDNTCNICI